MAARLKAAGYAAADVEVLATADKPKEGSVTAVLKGSDPKAGAILLLGHTMWSRRAGRTGRGTRSR
jgi:hypothetical protein